MKLFALLIIGIMLLGLTACGSDESTPTGGDGTDAGTDDGTGDEPETGDTVDPTELDSGLEEVDEVSGDDDESDLDSEVDDLETELEDW
ncbi:MAG: hypothetical protein KKG59_06730 [Nanoarchaeota archaeon]|nr:hypothetical protein [Nanoarchaeota archaeon]